MSSESVQKIQEEPSTSEVTKKVDQRRFFQCTDCGLNEEYTYFGTSPPFCKAIQFLEPSYLLQDPFSSSGGNNANFLLLGSNCALCSKMTCQECGTFFTKRLCQACFKLASRELPEELQQKLQKKKD